MLPSVPHHTSWKQTQKNRIMCVSESILLAITLQYLIHGPITMALCLTLTVVTAMKPDRHALGVCFTCLFSQESCILRSFLPPPSVFYCLQHRSAEMNGVSWGSRYIFSLVQTFLFLNVIYHLCKMQRLTGKNGDRENDTSHTGHVT